MKHQKISVDQYREKMKGIVRQILDLQDIEEIQNWFKGISSLLVFGRNYSPSNLLLVFSQKPNAIWTEGPKAWNRVHCYWNKDRFIYVFAPTAFGLFCLNPDCKALNFQKKDMTACCECGQPLGDRKPMPLGFKMIPVFDFEDVKVTEKAEKTKKVKLIRKLQEKRREHVGVYATSGAQYLAPYARALIDYLEAKGIEITAKPLNGQGARCMPGIIEYDEAIVMGENLGVLSHEWGHLAHHHGPDRASLKKDQKELEAEMFSALILSGLGADISAKAAYLLSWSEGADKETREIRFIRAFHRVYHEAVSTLEAIISATDVEMAELIENAQQIEQEEKSKFDKNKEKPKQEKQVQEKHADPETQTGSINGITVKRPGRLGTYSDKTFSGVAKTLVRDSKRYPGCVVSIDINIPGAKVSGGMILDPVLLSGGYLNSGAKLDTGRQIFLPNCPPEKETEKAHTVINLGPAIDPLASVAGFLLKNYDQPGAFPDPDVNTLPVVSVLNGEKPKLYPLDIRVKLKDFVRRVQSFHEANDILRQLATRLSENPVRVPSVSVNIVFDDDSEFKHEFPLNAKFSAGGDILQDEIQRYCAYVTGLNPGHLGKGIEPAIKEQAAQLMQYRLADCCEQEDLFDALFGPNYNPPKQGILSDWDFKEAFGDKPQKRRKRRNDTLWMDEGINDSIFAEDAVIKEAAEILGVADNPSFDFVADKDENIFSGLQFEEEGNPVELSF